MATEGTAPRPDTPESLFAERVRSDPASPLVTFYDDATGERAELSAKSMGNWVAKTHFLLLDELGLGSGDRAWVRLPVHWLAVPILFGCWYAGLEVVTSDSSVHDAEVLFADADSLVASGYSGTADRLSVSLLSMARSAEPPEGAADYATSVRPQPDAWPTVRPQAGSDDAALDGLSRAEVTSAAVARANELGLKDGGRLFWASLDFTGSDWIAALLAPLAVNGSVVLVRNPDRSAIARRASSERADVIAD
jgi:uncharacterized protein (TIGR03089 family)